MPCVRANIPPPTRARRSGLEPGRCGRRPALVRRGGARGRGLPGGLLALQAVQPGGASSHEPGPAGGLAGRAVWADPVGAVAVPAALTDPAQVEWQAVLGCRLAGLAGLAAGSSGGARSSAAVGRGLLGGTLHATPRPWGLPLAPCSLQGVGRALAHVLPPAVQDAAPHALRLVDTYIKARRGLLGAGRVGSGRSGTQALSSHSLFPRRAARGPAACMPCSAPPFLACPPAPAGPSRSARHLMPAAVFASACALQLGATTAGRAQQAEAHMLEECIHGCSGPPCPGNGLLHSTRQAGALSATQAFYIPLGELTHWAQAHAEYSPQQVGPACSCSSSWAWTSSAWPARFRAQLDGTGTGLTPASPAPSCVGPPCRAPADSPFWPAQQACPPALRRWACHPLWTGAGLDVVHRGEQRAEAERQGGAGGAGGVGLGTGGAWPSACHAVSSRA